MLFLSYEFKVCNILSDGYEVQWVTGCTSLVYTMQYLKKL